MTAPADELVAGMLWPAVGLVAAVRARDAAGVAAVVDGLTPVQVGALLVAVACMVPDDRSVGQLVLWTHGPDVRDEVAGQITMDVLLSARTSEVGPSKRCSRCARVRPLMAFHRGSPRDRLGRKSRCRECVAEVRRERLSAGV